MPLAIISSIIESSPVTAIRHTPTPRGTSHDRVMVNIVLARSMVLSARVQCTLLAVLSFTTRIDAFGRRNIHEVVINHIAKQATTSNAVEMTLTLPVDHFDNKRTIV